MLKLRHLGIGPSAAKPLAEQAATSVLYLALGEHNGGWGIDMDADKDRAERYVQAMKPDWDARVRLISKVGEKVLRYGVLTEDTFTWLEERPKPPPRRARGIRPDQPLRHRQGPHQRPA